MKNKKKIIFVLVALLVPTIIFAIINNLSKWHLSDLYCDVEFSKEGLNRVLSYNPEKEFSLFPRLNEKDFFKSINNLSICRRKEVRFFLYRYLTNDREYSINSINNSFSILPVIKQVFDKYPDMPKELMLLPLLESGFKTDAVSCAKATGLWQFMSATAKHFNLKNDYYVDERRAIEKSTEAAVRHLRHLYSIYKNWELTLAAYNAGSGYISNLLEKTQSNTFWSLLASGKLNRQTSEYVSRFAALIIIYQNANALSIKNMIVKEKVKKVNFMEVACSEKISDISKKYDVNIQLLKFYNPEIKGDKLPPYYPVYKILVPENTSKVSSN